MKKYPLLCDSQLPYTPVALCDITETNGTAFGTKNVFTSETEETLRHMAN